MFCGWGRGVRYKWEEGTGDPKEETGCRKPCTRACAGIGMIELCRRSQVAGHVAGGESDVVLDGGRRAGRIPGCRSDRVGGRLVGDVRARYTVSVEREEIGKRVALTCATIPLWEI